MPRLVPPAAAAYQLYVPVQPLAESVTVPVPQRLVLVAVGAVTPPVVDNVIEVVAVQPPAS